MRVISGKYGSRRLATLRGAALRPTSDRLRETLFDILQTRIEGSFFVDGYAGTGAAGIEALSRGARHVVFLEKHRAAVALIRKNLESLGISSGGRARHSSASDQDADPELSKRAEGPLATRHSGVEVVAGDVIAGLGGLAARGEPADILFFDPPYQEQAEYARVLEFLSDSVLVSPETLVIFERARKVALEQKYGPLVRKRTVVQGDAALDFFVRF